jgi:integrase
LPPFRALRSLQFKPKSGINGASLRATPQPLRWSVKWKKRQNSFERGEIAFVTSKTGRQQIIPIAARLREYIESELPISDDPKGPLFPKAFSSVAGQFERVGTLSNQFHDVMVEAGLVSHRAHAKKGTGRARKRLGAELSFHCLRHTATSLMKEAALGTGAESPIRFPQSPTRFPARSVSFRSVWPTAGLR